MCLVQNFANLLVTMAADYWEMTSWIEGLDQMT